MAITLRAVGTKVNGTTSVASLAQPTGTATGDVLLAFIVDHATSGNSAAPTGWQYRGGAAGAAGRLQVFSAVKGANSLSGTSWTFSGLTTRSMGQIIGYYGADQSGYGGLDVAISGRINASGTTGTATITTATANAKVIAAFCSLANGCTWSAEACATNPPLGERADSANSTYCSLALADGVQTIPGATGASSATMSTNAANGGALVALTPQAPGAAYYVDKINGDDTWDGLYPDHSLGGTHGPWKSLTNPCDPSKVGDDADHTINILANTGPYLPSDCQFLSLSYLYPGQGLAYTYTWNWNGNVLQFDQDYNHTSGFEWHQCTEVGKTTWYYLTATGSANPAIPQVQTCIVDGYWAPPACNLNNVGFTLYGHLLTDNWCWGNYDSLGFNTLYVKWHGGNPAGQSAEIWANAVDGYVIRTGYNVPTFIFNDGVFRGSGFADASYGIATVATPWIFNRCLFYNAAGAGIYLDDVAASGSQANYCKFINCGHRGVDIEAQLNFTGCNNYFENVHLALLDSSNTAHTVTWKNNSSYNLLAGFTEFGGTTPTFTESNNQIHLDPDTTHAGAAINFGGVGWATTAASDLPPNTATSLTTSIDPQVTAAVSNLSNAGLPAAGSPCIDAGVNVGLTQDFLGNPMVGAPDIGAYEIQAPATVSGILAGTLTPVTGAISGAQGVAGTAVGSLAGLTGAAAGIVRAEGGLAGSMAAVVGAVSGAQGVAGTAVGTLANITGAISGSEVTGTVAGSLNPVSGAIVGAHGVAGQITGSLTTITGSISGRHGVAGVVTGQINSITATISGSVGGIVTGLLAGTPANLTGSVSGKHGVAGMVAGTLATITGSFTGTIPGVVTGTLSGLLTNVTGSIVGAHGVTGTVANTLAKVTANITGAHGAAGTLTGQINSITATISGSVGGIVTGLLAGTLTPITASMIGLVVISGSLARTLQPVTAAINGTAGPDTAASWKFPALFSESGFSYGDYDPGQAAAIAIGCLHLYMKTGDSRASTWARRLLDDLRVNRQSPDYPYLYKSDLHYGWLNALVAQAFGLAVTGRPGQAYVFASTQEDHDHFLNMVNQFFAMAGDSKPNVLNADRIPFSYVEAVSSWEYAPNYIMNQQMGSLEALVLMLEVALDFARLQGDWDWFNRLLAFILRDNLVVLNQAQIRTVTAACDQAGAANLVRLRYADYDRDSSNYCEARDQAAIDNGGEQALDLDLRYGSPVILEDPAAARLLATRMLQRLAPPQEAVEVETWLEGVRIELGDTAAVSSDFHGWDREEFTVLGRDLDLGHRRVRLKLTRPLDRTDPFAVDAGGSASDAWAIDQASSWDENWDSRAYVY